MPMCCASMAAEVKNLCGRTDDAVLITANQVTTWMNEAQRDIVLRVPGLHAMGFKNTASLDTTQTLRYAISDITLDYTTQVISTVWNVFYMDGQDSKRLHWVHTDEFDANWIDPTNSESVTGRPHHWTRRGAYIEIRPLCATAYCDKGLRFDGDMFGRDFTSGDSTKYSDLSEADEGLKDYALSKAWRAIGETVKAVDCSRQYENFIENYQVRNDRLLEWDGNVFSSDIE